MIEEDINNPRELYESTADMIFKDCPQKYTFANAPKIAEKW